MMNPIMRTITVSLNPMDITWDMRKQDAPCLDCPFCERIPLPEEDDHTVLRLCRHPLYEGGFADNDSQLFDNCPFIKAERQVEK